LQAPRIFSSLWKQIRIFVDKRTYRKAQFVEGPKKEKGSKLRSRLSEIFDEELVEWLMIEVSYLKY
jgi:phosphodiesterase/alkaline phosphatase D-like protein